MRYLAAFLVMTHALHPGASAAADAPCERDCGGDIGCEAAVQQCFLENDMTRRAIDRLKPQVETHPDRPALARLLASAYLADGNTFWAERTLLAALEADPKDCGTHAWLAWMYLQSGDLDLAAEHLAAPGCPRTPAESARWNLLEYRIAVVQGNEGQAARRRERFMAAEELYEEENATWQAWWREARPEWVPPIQLQLKLLGGYTSNAGAGSPTDGTTDGEPSAIGRLDLFGRVVLPRPRFFRPTVEAGLKGHGLTAEEARRLSYLDMTIRPGLIIGDQTIRALVAYRGNLLLMALDGKERFYESHRAEVELETDFGLLIFGGVGRRIFVEQGRTRTEADAGAAGTFAPHPRLSLMAALSLRRFFAVGAPYDVMGGTLLLAGRLSLPKDIQIRTGITLSTDIYPDSGGERGMIAFGTPEKREDFSLKQFNELWSPSFGGVRAGIRYAFSYRDTSADSSNANYDYKEHRLFAAISVAMSLSPASPDVVRTDTHVPFVSSALTGGGDAHDEERIQDLLRQDEAARAGSACVD